MRRVAAGVAAAHVAGALFGVARAEEEAPPATYMNKGGDLHVVFTSQGSSWSCGMAAWIVAYRALHDVNNRDNRFCEAIGNIDNNFTMSLGIFDTQGTMDGSVHAMLKALDLEKWVGGEVEYAHGLIGMGSSGATMAAAGTTSVFRTPQVCYSSTNSQLSNKDLYPDFFRTTAPDSAVGLGIAKVLNSFGFKHSVAMWYDAAWPKGLCQDYMKAARDRDIKVDTYEMPQSGSSGGIPPPEVQDLIKGYLDTIHGRVARAIVVCGLSKELSLIYKWAREKGMMTDGYCGFL